MKAVMNVLEEVCRHGYRIQVKSIARPGGEDLPYLGLNSAHLARWRGNCLVHFGDPSTITDLSTALAGMDATAEAGLRCDLAAALHVTGEREEASHPLNLSRLADLLRLPANEHDMLRVHHADHGLGGAAARLRGPVSAAASGLGRPRPPHTGPNQR